MNDAQADLLIDVLKRLNDRLDEINTTLSNIESHTEEYATAIDNLCGAIEHVTGNIGPAGCLKVKVLP